MRLISFKFASTERHTLSSPCFFQYSTVCTILNGKPLFTLKFYDEILESTTGLVRLDFTKEGPGRAERIAKAYGEMTADAERMSPATRNLLGEMSEKGSTKGHFFRGVE